MDLSEPASRSGMAARGSSADAQGRRGGKPQGERKPPEGNRPGTFDFLGFTHFWARSRKGNWVLKRKTAANRFTRAVRTISRWCQVHRHDPIEEQHAALCQKLRGHAAYYGVTGNSPALGRFRYEVLLVWRKWLTRRRRAWRSPWSWFHQLLSRYPVPCLHVIRSACRSVANG
jgi:RNA-directed DNA polymerase